MWRLSTGLRELLDQSPGWVEKRSQRMGDRVAEDVHLEGDGRAIGLGGGGTVVIGCLKKSSLKKGVMKCKE
jgi:hypothetical protein